MDDKKGLTKQSRCCACGEENSFVYQRGAVVEWAKQICVPCGGKGFYISGFGDLCQRGIRAYTTAYDLGEAFKAYAEGKKGPK